MGRGAEQSRRARATGRARFAQLEWFLARACRPAALVEPADAAGAAPAARFSVLEERVPAPRYSHARAKQFLHVARVRVSLC